MDLETNEPIDVDAAANSATSAPNPGRHARVPSGMRTVSFSTVALLILPPTKSQCLKRRKCQKQTRPLTS